MLLLLLHPPGTSTAVVSGTVGPVAAPVAELGFDFFAVHAAIDSWTAGAGRLGYELAPGAPGSGWQTGDATT